MEQDPANTASFLITRLGGHMTWPLTVAVQPRVVDLVRLDP